MKKVRLEKAKAGILLGIAGAQGACRKSLAPCVLEDIMAALMRFGLVAVTLALAAACQPPQPAPDDPPPIASSGTPSAPEAAIRRQGNFETSPVDLKAMKTVPAAHQRMEVVEIYVDMNREGDMRKVLPYILKSDEWRILKSEHTGPLTRRYQFARIVSASGDPPPPDPFLSPPK